MAEKALTEEYENEINIWGCTVWDLISSCTNKRKLEIVSRSYLLIENGK